MMFSLVGGSGFVVDLAAMYCLSTLVSFEVARALAFWVAASSNWWVNRTFTYRNFTDNGAEHDGLIRQWIRFLCSAVIGFIPNYLVYWGLITAFPPEWWALSSERPLFGAMWPYIAMVPGVLCGMLVNFTLSERWVFRHQAAK
ncbi:GtrA family protein [Photobacterium sanctipauli]|uniref:GtrA family protein n=2 Tax=Photobacterium sanctipauli TaxID=1342794 RepID=A0A2T3NUJ4_9GAMM|nr:GtrA family protein [Photobacterium sanctipauli]